MELYKVVFITKEGEPIHHVRFKTDKLMLSDEQDYFQGTSKKIATSSSSYSISEPICLMRG